MEEIMFEAIQEKSMEKLKDILAAGADVNAKNAKGKTALQEAVGCYSPEMTQLLIDSGAEVNAQIRKEFDALLMDNMYSDLPYTTGYFYDNVDDYIIPIIKSLIIGGANVNLKDTSNEGYTILHTAAYVTDADLIKFLLDRGAIVDARNAQGETPLHLAAENPCEASKLEVLLEAGADPNAKENLGLTPLHYPFLINIKFRVGEERVVEAIKVLKKYNADFNAEDNDGRTVAYYFTHINLKLFRALIDIGGVDVNDIVSRKGLPEVKRKGPCDCAGQTMLHIVCYNEHLLYEKVKCLCKMGADINVLDSRNMTPLQYAISSEIDVRTIKYLLKKNARIDTIGGHNILNLKMTSRRNQGSPIPKYIWKILVEHLAKLSAAGYCLDEITIETLEGNPCYSNYFDKCTKELDRLKKTELPLTGATFFNLLVDEKKKLIHYARNRAAYKEFKRTYSQTSCPIYKSSIYHRFNKALIFVGSSVILSSCLPCNLNSSHIIIEKILGSFTSKDLSILCKYKNVPVKR